MQTKKKIKMPHFANMHIETIRTGNIFSKCEFQTEPADYTASRTFASDDSDAAGDPHHRQLHGSGEVLRADDGHVQNAADPGERAPGRLQPFVRHVTSSCPRIWHRQGIRRICWRSRIQRYMDENLHGSTPAECKMKCFNK